MGGGPGLIRNPTDLCNSFLLKLLQEPALRHVVTSARMLLASRGRVKVHFGVTISRTEHHSFQKAN